MAVRARRNQPRSIAALRGSGSHSPARHVHQFQLASLELEQTRRNQERDVAMKRIQELDARLAEINKLMRKHHQALGLKSEGGTEQERVARQETGSDRRRVLRY